MRRLHALGWAHSFETWQDGRLVGGLYGVAIGRAFFGESMFTRVTDASKVALVHAVEFLRTRGTEIIDCQVASAHTAEPRRRRYSARASSYRSSPNCAPNPRIAADVAFRLISAVCRAFLRLCNNAPPPGGSQTVAEWQKKKQFKWKVR